MSFFLVILAGGVNEAGPKIVILNMIFG